MQALGSIAPYAERADVRWRESQDHAIPPTNGESEAMPGIRLSIARSKMTLIFSRIRVMVIVWRQHNAAYFL
jgi:hypothetical protein